MARALSRQAAHQQGSAGAGPPGAGRVKPSPPRRVGPAMGILSATGLDRFNPAQSGVRGMRIVATGLLVLMAALYAGARGRFLADPQGEGRLRAGATRMASDVLEALDQEKLGGMVKGAVAQRLLALDVAAPLGQALTQAIDEDRHVPILDAGVAWLA